MTNCEGQQSLLYKSITFFLTTHNKSHQIINNKNYCGSSCDIRIFHKNEEISSIAWNIKFATIMQNSPKDGENSSRGFDEMKSMALDPNL